MSQESEYPPLSKARLGQLRKLSLKKFREVEGQFLVEGEHLVEMALISGARCEQVIATRDYLERMSPKMRALCKRSRIPVIVAASKDFEVLSETVTSQGVLAVIHSSSVTLDSIIKPGGPSLIVALDAISDPGNLGTIVRTCDWFGVEGLVAGIGTVDVHNAKVVRATQGSVFNEKIVEGIDLVPALGRLRRAGYEVWGTVLSDVTKIGAVRVPERCVMVFGSEADGLTPSVISACDRLVTIPGFGSAESLNVSVSVGVVLGLVRLGRLTGDRASGQH